MTDKLKAAIVGYGKMGKIRAECIKNHPNTELIAICEINPENRVTEIAVCTNYKELLKFKPDVIFACTPNRYLPDIVCYFLNCGLHVFCEKPPGRSKEDVERMLKAEKNNPGTKLKFGFNHRYHKAVFEAKSIINKGRIGKIMWMRGIYGKGGENRYDQSWRNKKSLSGGGILIDQGIHMVDLFRFFCGEFDEVKSFITRSYWPVEVEDNVFALLRNKQGQVAMLHSSATQWRYNFLLDIYLEKGYITISGILSSTRNYAPETLKVARCTYDIEGYPLPNPEETIAYYDEDTSWMSELEEFVNCILEDMPIQVGSCLEAYKTILLIEKIYSADKTWRWPEPKKENLYHEKSSFVK